ncbi:MAG: hypothetical protein AAGD06_28780 [Acidobacteriota bacterium]
MSRSTESRAESPAPVAFGDVVDIDRFRRVFVLGLGLFVLNKFVLRPWVVERFPEGVAALVVGSLPNAVEAVLGTLILSVFGFRLRSGWPGRFRNPSDGALIAAATTVAGVYVVTQELKFHNLGGRNVYDPYDVAASLLGLAAAAAWIVPWVRRGGDS